MSKNIAESSLSQKGWYNKPTKLQFQLINYGLQPLVSYTIIRQIIRCRVTANLRRPQQKSKTLTRKGADNTTSFVAVHPMALMDQVSS